MISTEQVKPPEARLVQWFDDHYYVVLDAEGKETFLPSVTNVLGVVSDPFLARWRGDVGNREADYRRDQAGDRGSRIHHACYTYLHGGVVLFQPSWAPNFKEAEIQQMRLSQVPMIVLENQDEYWQVCKCVSWFEAVKPEVVGTEMIVYSLELGVAGTLDVAARIPKGKYPIAGREPLELEGGLYVIDWKSGRDIDDNAELQVSQYGRLLEGMLKEEVKGGLLVHLTAQTKLGIEGLTTKLINRQVMETNWGDFDHILKVWVRKNPNAKPNVRILPAMLAREINREGPLQAPPQAVGSAEQKEQAGARVEPFTLLSAEPKKGKGKKAAKSKKPRKAKV